MKSSWDPPAGAAQAIRELPGAVQDYLGDIAKVKIFQSGGLLGQTVESQELKWGRKIKIKKEEAIKLARGYLDEINGVEGGRDSDEARTVFVELAEKHSNCASRIRGGDLGWFDRDQMEAEFERVAYALPIGKISDIVSTASGVHLIMKTGGAVHVTKAPKGMSTTTNSKRKADATADQRDVQAR
ncbi:hypothetical protein BD779DRAFT_1487933 [Infundibulicybe gibba]|nr:hypothetical protein BD779DRAFT_1487933 [Infundibulicybe gibba]